MDVSSILTQLTTRTLKVRILTLDAVTSTNDEAKLLATKGADDGTVIFAQKQTGGRGRFTRAWFSPLGGLYMSVILSPRVDVKKAPLMSLLCSCAVIEAIDRVSGVKAALKWPNDIVVDDRKLGGILSELITNPAPLTIIGIGINLNCSTTDFPQELQKSAVSLVDITKKTIPIAKMVAAIINAIDTRLVYVESANSFHTILREYIPLCTTIGRTVSATVGDRQIIGRATGIANDGSLILVQPDGFRVHISTGEVFHLR